MRNPALCVLTGALLGALIPLVIGALLIEFVDICPEEFCQ